MYHIDIEKRYQLYKENENKLSRLQLLEVLDSMKELLSETDDGECTVEWNSINDTYRNLLEYLQKGVEDSYRNTLLRQLLLRTWNLNDRMFYNYRSNYSTDGIFELHLDLIMGNYRFEMERQLEEMVKWGRIMRQIESVPLDDPAQNNQTLQQYENYYNNLFNIILTSYCWTKEDEQAAMRILELDDIYVYDLLLMISAVTLSLCMWYDEARLSFLIAAFQKKNNSKVRARALTGIAVCCFRHANRIQLDSKMMKLLTETLPDNPEYLAGMKLLQQELFITMHTDSASRKLDEEIIPAMMKSNYFRPVKFGFQDVDDTLNSGDSNPEGVDENEIQGLENKLREINDMHLKGLDVYMTTFSHLKSFSFFDLMSNWFYPFNPCHYRIKGVCVAEGKTAAMLRSLFDDMPFCDSDKYSFSMLLGKISTMERSMLESQIESEMEKIDLPVKFKEDGKISLMVEIRNYLQNMFRFYKLNIDLEDAMLFNPFDGDVNFLHNMVLKRMFKNTETLRDIAGVAYQIGDYTQALEYLKLLDSKKSPDVSVYQREGYCFQMLKKYREALTAYEKADLIKPGELWNYRQMAYCYRHLRAYEKALEYYLKLEKTDPENKFLILRTGECLLQEKRYDEAQQRFFKVEYHEPDYLPALRAIAWCAFLSGDLERAGKYYTRILHIISQRKDYVLDGEHTFNEEYATDFLNAGHTAAAGKQWGQAVAYYRKFMAYSRTKSWKELWDDFPILNRTYRISKVEISLVLEAARLDA